MKATQFCAPLFLMLTIACDDSQQVQTLEHGDSATLRAEKSSGQSKLIGHAGYLISVDNLINRLGHEIDSSLAFSQQLGCDVVSSGLLEKIEDECGDLENWGTTLALSNCRDDNGNSFDAQITVSPIGFSPSFTPNRTEDTPYNAAKILSRAGEWGVKIDVQAGSGMDLNACGTTNHPNAESLRDYTLTLLDQNGRQSEYWVSGAESRDDRTRTEHSVEFDLIATDGDDSQVTHLRSSYRANDMAIITPSLGRAVVHSESTTGRLRFDKDSSQRNSVLDHSRLRTSSKVVIPTL